MFFIVKYIILILIFFKCIIGDEGAARKTLFIPNLRKEIEEIPSIETQKSNIGDAEPNLVSIMVRNVKELFSETENTSTVVDLAKEVNYETGTGTIPTMVENAGDDTDTITDIAASDLYGELNISLTTIFEKFAEKIQAPTSSVTNYKATYYSEATVPSQGLLLKLDNKKQEDKNTNNLSKLSHKNDTSSEKDIIYKQSHSIISCISCDNILLQDCDDPANKLVPSNFCKHKDEICYTRHTPFGLVQRGCFNLNHNLTVFVCSCNLCNSVSIYDMPYMFSSKEEWVKNIIEMSRTKRFRKTIFKEMSCLRCEVNSTSKDDDETNENNCLEGKIGTLPTQECAHNEICGVKSIKSKGYIWRGCLAKPLYNHLWKFCEKDFCNYDKVVSVFD